MRVARVRLARSVRYTSCSQRPHARGGGAARCPHIEQTGRACTLMRSACQLTRGTREADFGIAMRAIRSTHEVEIPCVRYKRETVAIEKRLLVEKEWQPSGHSRGHACQSRSTNVDQATSDAASYGAHPSRRSEPLANPTQLIPRWKRSRGVRRRGASSRVWSTPLTEGSLVFDAACIVQMIPYPCCNTIWPAAGLLSGPRWRGRGPSCRSDLAPIILSSSMWPPHSRGPVR